jgi:hypothetical protein
MSPFKFKVTNPMAPNGAGINEKITGRCFKF